MKITVKCFATLSDRQPENDSEYDFRGSTLGDLLAELAIDQDEVALLFVNNLHSEPKRELVEGDRVGIFPPVGGG
ncbi:MAG: MoaD/ThiS family protein [Desulfovibrio sp.]|uniref:MoaD/ThiS family protein n=1 Tax=Desulfovibrio sp. 7SRBS1 TaxID=3378064 RepID=UPI003B3F2E75